MAVSSSSVAPKNKTLSITCEPLTRKELLSSHPRLFCIYTNEAGQEPQFIAVAEKTRGTALGTFYDMVARLPFLPSRWLGKVGLPTGHLRDDPNTIRSRTKKDINLDTILEMLGYTLYQELGRDLFVVPNTFLSLQPIMDDFTLGHALAVEWVRSRITKSLRIMCELVPGYSNFAEATTSEDGAPLPLIEFIRKNHRPPLTILNPSGRAVPLLGMMELIAVIRILADTDGLGGKGENAGFRWVKEGETVIAARAVKIDPGCSFRFSHEEEGPNRVINTVRQLSLPKYRLIDTRNIQIANNDTSVDIHWSSLLAEQQEIFLSTLMNSLRYRNNEGVLKLLFYRDGKFYKSPTKQIPEQIADKLVHEMREWIGLQEQIYRDDLKAFYIAHPEQLLRIQYIDTYGQLPLPTSDETFPIRELFTELVLMEQEAQVSEEQAAAARNPELAEKDSLQDTFERLQHVEKAIPLEDLFQTAEGETPPHRILLLGRAGIGKSTLCQKIAHDWASGRLWNDRYKAVYWIPLRECNHFLEEEPDPRKWISKALARLILKEGFLESSIEAQLRDNPQEILFLLDGYDEATPDVAYRIKELLEIPNLNLFITSRPGRTEDLRVDRTVENMGFSDDQIVSYIHRFLQRGQATVANITLQKTSLLSAIKANRNLFSLAHIPLQLQMLCSIWEKGASAKGFPSTLTDLYRTMVQEIFRWQCRRERIDPDDVSPRERKTLYNCLGDIALSGLKSGKLLISERILQQALDRFEISHKKLLSSGLLKAAGEGAQREYYFIHLSYQEYMIALSIAQKTPPEREQFILSYRYQPQFLLVFSFLAGIINEKSDKEEIKLFIETLHTKKTGPNGELFEIDLLGSSQFELTLRCLSECDLSVQQWANEKYHVYEVLSDLILQTENRQMRNRALSWCKQNNIPSETMSDIIRKLGSALCHHRPEMTSNDSQREAASSLVALSEGADSLKWYEIWTIFDTALKHENEHIRLAAAGYLKLLIKKSPLKNGWETRQEAWPRLSKNIQWQVFSTIQDLLHAIPGEIRKSAIESIKYIGIETFPFHDIFSVLVNGIDDPNPGVRKATVKLLKFLCKAFPEQWEDLKMVMKTALKTAHLKVRNAALYSLTSLAEKVFPERWDEVLKLVEMSLNDPIDHNLDNIREATFYSLKSLAKNTTPERWGKIFAVLKKALINGKDWAAQDAAAECLIYLSKKNLPQKREEIWAAFEEALNVTNFTTRAIALSYLGSLDKEILSEKWEKALEFLKTALNDPDKHIRIIALRSLKTLCQQTSAEKWIDVFELLKMALKDKDENVQKEAIASLGSFSEEVPAERWEELWATLKAVLEDENWEVRSTGALALGVFIKKAPPQKWEELWTTLKVMLKDHHGFVRRQSVESIISCAKEALLKRRIEFWSVLNESLSDEFEEIRILSLYLLNSLDEEIPSELKSKFCTSLVKVLKVAISQPQNYFLDPYSQINSLKFLGSIGKKPSQEIWALVFAACVETLNNERPNVRQEAIKSLELIGAEASPEQLRAIVEALSNALKDKNEFVQNQAVESLGSLCKKAPLERRKEIFKALNDQLLSVPPRLEESLQNLFKTILSEKWDELFLMHWNQPLIKIYIDLCMKQQKPLCLQQIDLAQSPKLYFGHNQMESSPFTTKFMQMMRQVVAATPFGKYVASYIN